MLYRWTLDYLPKTSYLSICSIRAHLFGSFSLTRQNNKSRLVFIYRHTLQRCIVYFLKLVQHGKIWSWAPDSVVGSLIERRSKGSHPLWIGKNRILGCQCNHRRDKLSYHESRVHVSPSVMESTCLKDRYVSITQCQSQNRKSHSIIVHHRALQTSTFVIPWRWPKSCTLTLAKVHLFWSQATTLV